MVALLDHPRHGRFRALAGAGARYGYMVSATTLIRRRLKIRRLLGLGTTVLGVGLDGLAGPSRFVPWFAAAYYPKLLLGHAAAALWSDQTLHGEKERRVAGVPFTPHSMTGFPTVHVGRRVDAEDVVTLMDDE